MAIVWSSGCLWHGLRARVGLSATALRTTLRIHVANEPDS